MFSTGATVLVVDNDQEVINLTRLALRSFKVDGQPLKIRSVPGGAQAAALLKSELTLQQGISTVPVALIGITAETSSAGVELCRYLREELGNRETQLYLRVERNSDVPERDIFDRYVIGGYYSSAEIPLDRLYSMVKSGTSHARMLMRQRVFFNLLERLILAGSRDAMAEVFSAVIAAMSWDARGEPHEFGDTRAAFILDGKLVAQHPDLAEAEALERWRSLRLLPGTVLHPAGDKYCCDDRFFLLEVADGPGHSAFAYLCPLTGELPDSFAVQFHSPARLIAALWRRASWRVP